MGYLLRDICTLYLYIPSIIGEPTRQMPVTENSDVYLPQPYGLIINVYGPLIFAGRNCGTIGHIIHASTYIVHQLTLYYFTPIGTYSFLGLLELNGFFCPHVACSVLSRIRCVAASRELRSTYYYSTYSV